MPSQTNQQARTLARLDQESASTGVQRRANGHDVRGQLASNAQFKRQMIAQMRGQRGGEDTSAVLNAAAQGVQGSGGALPYLSAIQRSFGHHDVRGVQAFVGGQAKTASDAIGAEAYATGNSVAFRGSPTLHTAAHEAAHIVQQRAGVQLSGGVGQVGDKYERHADAVADRVVQGKSAADLLDQFTGAKAPAEGVQRKEVNDAPKQTYVPGDGKLKGGFHIRARVPGKLWFRAEAERMSIDTPVRAARDTVEAEMLGRGLIGTIRPGASAGAKLPGSMVGGTVTGGAKMVMNGKDHSKAAILQRKWDEYLIHLAYFGFGLDPQYRIVDATGKVVDTWWYDNLR